MALIEHPSAESSEDSGTLFDKKMIVASRADLNGIRRRAFPISDMETLLIQQVILSFRSKI